jgi:beta-lactamase class A
MSFRSRLSGKTALTHALAACVGCVLFVVMHWALHELPSCNRAFDLLSPSRRCNDALQLGEWDYEPMRARLSDAASALRQEGKISEISIYFRDLTNGPRFRIGEYAGFQPASLVKLPVMIALLHEADVDPSVLDVPLSFSGSLGVNDNVEESGETIQPDVTYTVRELIEKMIVYSDNQSYKLLMRHMNEQPPILAYLAFRDLNVLRMMTAPNADVVSILPYGDLFAVLYNTGYLSRPSSQRALELLSRSTFDEGIVAGTPEGTVVAHKFGRRVLEDADDQLHDCGIVYHPKAAYVLCVMTSGPSYREQKNAIAEVSRIVYDGVSEEHPGAF